MISQVQSKRSRLPFFTGEDQAIKSGSSFDAFDHLRANNASIRTKNLANFLEYFSDNWKSEKLNDAWKSQAQWKRFSRRWQSSSELDMILNAFLMGSPGSPSIPIAQAWTTDLNGARPERMLAALDGSSICWNLAIHTIWILRASQACSTLSHMLTTGRKTSSHVLECVFHLKSSAMEIRLCMGVTCEHGKTNAPLHQRLISSSAGASTSPDLPRKWCGLECCYFPDYHEHWYSKHGSQHMQMTRHCLWCKLVQ